VYVPIDAPVKMPMDKLDVKLGLPYRGLKEHVPTLLGSPDKIRSTLWGDPLVSVTEIVEAYDAEPLMMVTATG